jgi:hypothetical protein
VYLIDSVDEIAWLIESFSTSWIKLRECEVRLFLPDKFAHNRRMKPKCHNLHPISGLTPVKGNNKFDIECTGIEQVLTALYAEARRKAGFCVFSVKFWLLDRPKSHKEGYA